MKLVWFVNKIIKMEKAMEVGIREAKTKLSKWKSGFVRRKRNCPS